MVSKPMDRLTTVGGSVRQRGYRSASARARGAWGGRRERGGGGRHSVFMRVLLSGGVATGRKD